MASIVQQSSCFDPYVDADLSEFLLDQLGRLRVQVRH